MHAAQGPHPDVPTQHPHTHACPRLRRLTQNVVDGCGVLGVEGVFMTTAELTLTVRGGGPEGGFAELASECAEAGAPSARAHARRDGGRQCTCMSPLPSPAAVQVLRRHQDTVLSVMDGFVHDPLVEWVRSGARKEGEAGNPHAQDALATIKGTMGVTKGRRWKGLQANRGQSDAEGAVPSEQIGKPELSLTDQGLRLQRWFQAPPVPLPPSSSTPPTHATQTHSQAGSRARCWA